MTCTPARDGTYTGSHVDLAGNVEHRAVRLVPFDLGCRRIDCKHAVALLLERPQCLVAELPAISGGADHSHALAHDPMYPQLSRSVGPSAFGFSRIDPVASGFSRKFPCVGFSRKSACVVQLVDAIPCRRARRPNGRGRTGAGRGDIEGTPPVLRLRARVPDSRRGGRRVPGALQSRWRAARALWLCRRRPVRSHRKEAVLSRASRGARVQLRHARLRPALFVLPELGDVAGAPRSAGRRSPARRFARGAGDRGASSRTRRVVVSTYNEPLITSEWGVAIFREARAGGAADGVRVERQRHAPRARVHPALGRSLQGRSQELRRPALSSARRTHRAHPVHDSRLCTRWASGWKS